MSDSHESYLKDRLRICKMNCFQDNFLDNLEWLPALTTDCGGTGSPQTDHYSRKGCES